MAVEWVKGVVPESVREAWRQGRMTGREGGGGGGKGAVAVAGEDEGMVEGYAVVVKGDGDGDGGEVGAVGYDHGVKEAEERNESENASESCCCT